MLFEKAQGLLNAEYETYYQDATEHARKVMNEKKFHSYQVLGVGNYFLKQEALFHNCSSAELQKLKATLLLHDIGRFYEVFLHEDGGRVDHGVYGAKLLEQKSSFNDAEVILPIRHHGHLIERLWEDSDYSNLSENERRKIQIIIYLVRDADKIANFYLLSRHFKEMENLFFLKSLLDYQTKIPSPLVWEAFMKHSAVDVKNVKSFADQAIMYMACVFDLAYESSFILLDKLNILQKLFDCFKKFWADDYAQICEYELWTYCEARLRGDKNFFDF